MGETWRHTIVSAFEQPLFWWAIGTFFIFFGIKETIYQSINWNKAGQVMIGWGLAMLIGILLSHG